MSSSTLRSLLLLAGATAAGVAVWALVLRSPDDDGTDDRPDGGAGDARARESDVPSAAPRPRTADAEVPMARVREEGPPREGIFSKEEVFPATTQLPHEIRIELPKGEPGGTVRGGVVRDAILRVPGLYLRWENEDVKRKFLVTEFTLPEPATGEGPGAGASLPEFAAWIDRAGSFHPILRPPLLGITSRRAVSD